MSAIAQNGIDQSRMIENGIARFEIAQKIDQGNLIGLGARERAHDKVEISGGEARPTIRSDHRELIVRDGGAYGKPEFSLGSIPPPRDWPVVVGNYRSCLMKLL